MHTRSVQRDPDRCIVGWQQLGGLLMSDCKSGTGEADPRPIRRFIFISCTAMALLAAITLIAIIVFAPNPRRLVPGEVIDRLGVFRFPTGNRTLSITRDDFGNIHVTVHYQTTRFYLIPHSYADSLIVFESERDWFLSVDQYERLWLYRGHWDREWGKLRRMPSGGTISYAPAVIMEGAVVTTSGQLFSGNRNVVTETGYWAGVPQDFFDRIPGRNGAQWGNVKPLPKTAPQFTKQQQQQIEARLRESS